jgi:hypothetical protein
MLGYVRLGYVLKLLLVTSCVISPEVVESDSSRRFYKQLKLHGVIPQKTTTELQSPYL